MTQMGMRVSRVIGFPLRIPGFVVMRLRAHLLAVSWQD